MYLKRNLTTVIEKINHQFPAILITGPRQIGKTTFFKHLSDKSRKYVTLDDPLILELAKNDPKLFLERFPPPVIIDEIQYAPVNAKNKVRVFCKN